MGARLPEIVLIEYKETAMNEIRVVPDPRVKIDIGILPPLKPRGPSDPPLKRAAPAPPPPPSPTKPPGANKNDG